MKTNPVPTLRYAITPHILSQITEKPIRQISHLFEPGSKISDSDYEKLRPYVLTLWGEHPDPATRSLLWELYYPQNKPNIFQVLYYRCDVPLAKLTANSMSEKTVRSNLLRSRVPIVQVRKIAPYALALSAEFHSHKRADGPDPRGHEIDVALRDPERIKFYGN